MNDRPIAPSSRSMHLYEVRPRKDKRGVDLVSDALPFGRLWYEDVSAAVDYAKHSSRSHDAVIRVYDEAAMCLKRTSTRAISKSHDSSSCRACGRIHCCRRNPIELRLRRAQRCGEAATPGDRWVSPRLIPGSPQSLSKLLSNVQITERVRHRTRPGCRGFPYRATGGTQHLDAA